MAATESPSRNEELLQYEAAEAPKGVCLTAAIARAIVVFLLGVVLGCSPQRGEGRELLVFAAASLTDVLSEAGRAYQTESGVLVSFSYGGSQALAQQIARGAPADVLIAAGEAPVRFLVDGGHVEPDTVDLASNHLVAVTGPAVIGLESMDQLARDDIRHLALADPPLAPAGQYAKESLTRLGLWDDLQDKLVFGADVRSALTYVETGNAEVALVYLTDARMARGGKVVDIVPPESYSRVTYPGAIVSRSERKRQAQGFLDYLRRDEGKAIFEKYGFRPLEG